MRNIETAMHQHSSYKEYLLAKHGEVGLADDEGEEEVDADSDSLACVSGLNVMELRGHQPPQGPPGPGKASSEEALKG